MRIALTHNLRLTDSEDEAEFDSPETISAIASTLERSGHRVERIDVTGPASRLVARLEAFAPDIIFNTAEGRRGKVRRGFYPALFEELGMVATGSDAYTLCVTLDKAWTKRFLAGYGITSPRGRFVTRTDLRAGGLDDFAFPVIVKPNFEGSSKGIDQGSVVDCPMDLGRVLDDLLTRYPDGVLVERYVLGVDVRVSRVDGIKTPLVPLEIAVDPAYPRRHAILDFALAHREGRFVSRRVPDNLSPALLARLNDVADRAFQALGMRDASSLDFRISPEGEIYFLSATALPSFEYDSALFTAARAVGLDYDAVVLAVLRSAALRGGLTSQLDTTKPKRSPRRTQLRVGLAFNMKRIDSTDGDDREAEYDSPETIDAIGKAIESYGHTVVPLEATAEFPRTLMGSDVDLVFNIAEGMRGRNREGQVPSLCELLGVPYTGSDAATLSICLDKALTKRMIPDVPTPQSQVLYTGRERLRPMRYPVIVKPNHEGTSKGISLSSVVDSEAEARDLARELIEKYRQPALVEEYIPGREFTVGLLGERRPRVLPPMEVIFLKESERPVYDYVCKQDWENHVRYDCPANLTKEELRSMERVCKSAFMALGCRDVARIDVRLAPDGTVYVIEVNPLPGLTPNYSDLCLIARGAKMDYRTLIGEILAGGIKRWRERQEGAGVDRSTRAVDESPSSPLLMSN